jgi:hypothetical protein
LADAVSALIATAGNTPWAALIGELPLEDRTKLLHAAPRDVFVTALHAWRTEPGDKGGRAVRALVVAGLVLSAKRIYPKIAAAQRELRGRA